MAIEDWLQGNKGLGSLLPGKGGERMKPLPPTRRPIEQPGTWLVPPDRPPITEPIGPRPPRPPGESIQAKIRQLQIQKRQLIQQIRQIDAQIHSLSGSRGFPIPWHDDTGGEPPPPPLNPPTIVRPPGIPIEDMPKIPPPPGYGRRPPWGG